MSMRKTTPFFYEGMIFVCSDGSVYREVSRGDILQKKKVFSIQLEGFRFTSLENLLKEICFSGSPLTIYDGVEYVRHDDGDGSGVFATTTPTDVFTGTSRVRGAPVDIVYVTPVTVAVFDKQEPRSSSR